MNSQKHNEVIWLGAKLYCIRKNKIEITPAIDTVKVQLFTGFSYWYTQNKRATFRDFEML